MMATPDQSHALGPWYPPATRASCGTARSMYRMSVVFIFPPPACCPLIGSCSCPYLIQTPRWPESHFAKPRRYSRQQSRVQFSVPGGFGAAGRNDPTSQVSSTREISSSTAERHV
jgi:hypothetical protein